MFVLSVMLGLAKHDTTQVQVSIVVRAYMGWSVRWEIALTEPTHTRTESALTGIQPSSKRVVIMTAES